MSGIKPYDVCVMADVSIQATVRVHAADRTGAACEALKLADAGKVEFNVCEYDRRYYVCGGDSDSIIEVDEEAEEANPLKQFLYLLNSSYAISVDDQEPTTKITLAESSGDLDDELVLIQWEHESVPHSIKLTLEGISEGKIDQGAFVCNDHEGDAVRLRFFVLTPQVL